ncbi:hypothetical protein G6K88_13845 [Agrobacterium rhizogenes]|uniref:hypothetical protein n=1 Tax=Rhizobium rhizogenes TaxID=359 RepID=UPI00115E0A74|nr:hypothetical protein [Rhizobium rhizogenes]NTI03102.1 hypothetical protein [Rhizobium rhizogenes]NTI09906.1 hypothetical protein [Rhizobium rhizogenes]TRB20251.1 hypothetical protein EXN70_26330 [Rhizobium rhizogenes]
MASKCSAIDKNDVISAVRMTRSGTPDGKIFVHTDKSTRGLMLRVQGKKAAWVVKYKNDTATIAFAHPEDEPRYVSALSKIQELARVVRTMLENGDKAQVSSYLTSYYLERAGDTSKNKIGTAKQALVTMKAAVANDAWTLKDCVDAAIKMKTAPDAKRKIKIKPSAEKDMRTTFSRSAFKIAMTKPVLHLSLNDIESVRDTVYRESGPSPANKVVTYTRSVLNFCRKYHSKSGLQTVDRWWEMLDAPYEVEAREREPSIKEVVQTMILAEEYLSKPLPGRAFSTNGVRPGSLAALWWIVLTCQRVDAGLSLLPYNVVEDEERLGSGWLLAGWDAADQKGGKSFVLPVPARAWNFVDSFRKKSKTTTSVDWAFPSEVKPEVHISASGTYRIVYRLAGRDKLVQEKSNKKRDRSADKSGRKWTPPVRTERRDLLKDAGIDWWSHHDLRRTMSSFMSMRRMPGGASAILAHEVKDDTRLRASQTEQQRIDFQKERAAKITQTAYGAESQFIQLKSLAMQAWTDAVLDEYDGQKAASIITLQAA